MTKLTAYLICFGMNIIWAISERIFNIDSILDQVIIALILLVFIIRDNS